jgi:hypothetical protein
MQNRLMALLGIFLGSSLAAFAQTPAPRTVLPQEHFAPPVARLRTASIPATPASFLIYPNAEKSPAPFSRLFGGAYGSAGSVERLPPTEEFKILFFSRSNRPLVQLWGGRLQLGVFESTLHTPNVPLDPLAYRGFRSSRLTYSGGPSSVHLSGLSLSFHFGRQERTARPTQAWEYLPRIVHTVLN